MIIEKTTFTKSDNTMLNRYSSFYLNGTIKDEVENEVERSTKDGDKVVVLTMNDAFAILVEENETFYTTILISNTERKGVED